MPISIPSQKTPKEILLQYFPESWMLDAMRDDTSDYSLLLSSYVDQFAQFVNIAKTLLINFIPSFDSPKQLVELWEVVFGLPSNPFFPVWASRENNSIDIRWAWVCYAFSQFENIRTVQDINTCLFTLKLPVQAARFTQCTEVVQTALEDDNGGPYNNPEAIVVFDIRAFSFDLSKKFDYEFPVDFYQGFDRPTLELFLSSLVPITVLPLFYDGSDDSGPLVSNPGKPVGLLLSITNA